MSWAGRKMLGSSRLPTRIVTSSGLMPGWPNRGDPQSAQKTRLVVAPTVGREVKVLRTPLGYLEGRTGNRKDGGIGAPVSR